MATAPPTLESTHTGKLVILTAIEDFEPILADGSTAVASSIGYSSADRFSTNDSTTGHGTPPAPSPNSTTGHGTPPAPSPNSTTGHGTPPAPSPNSTTGHGTPPAPSPNLTATIMDYPTIGQIMSWGGIRSTTQLAFQIQTHPNQKMPDAFAVQVVAGNNQVLFQTDMTSFHGHDLGDKIVLGFDTEAAQEAANYFGLQNYLRVVTKTEDDMNKIQAVVIGKRSNQ